LPQGEPELAGSKTITTVEGDTLNLLAGRTWLPRWTPLRNLTRNCFALMATWCWEATLGRASLSS